MWGHTFFSISLRVSCGEMYAPTYNVVTCVPLAAKYPLPPKGVRCCENNFSRYLDDDMLQQPTIN